MRYEVSISEADTTRTVLNTSTPTAPIYFFSKNSMSTYLPLQLSIGNHLASCTSTYMYHRCIISIFIEIHQTV